MAERDVVARGHAALPPYGYGSGYGCGSGDGCGYGDGCGSGSGSGCSYGDGSGYGYGCSYGDGSGYGYGDGYGDGDGDGSGDGSGDGYGDGSGYGYGDGSGYGYGSGDGDGYGYGYGSGYWAAALEPYAAQTGVLAWWRSGADGRPANGGKGASAGAGMAVRVPGPLALCSKQALHATMAPEKWGGDRLWVVELRGEVHCSDDKLGALERVIVAEVT